MDIDNISNGILGYRLSRPKQYPFYTVWGGITFPTCQPNPAQFRNFYTLVYVCEGSGIVFQQNNEICASEGDFLILSPGYTYSFSADKNHPWKQLWCAVSNTSFMSGLISAYNIENIKIFKKINSPLQLENIFKVLEKQNSDDASFRTIEKLLFETICQLSDFASTHSPSMSIAEMGKAYIDTNGITTSINEVCKHLSISPSYFFRLFTKEFGISPQKYIMTKKLDVAMDSLRYTSLSIGQISDLLGYENIGSFSGFFSKKTGMTPLEYRKTKSELPLDN